VAILGSSNFLVSGERLLADFLVNHNSPTPLCFS
jgi:hypothetical protein